MFEVLLKAWYGIGKKREDQNMNHEINQLIQFGLDHHLIQEEDVDYTVNLLLDLLKMNEFYKEDIHETISDSTGILEKMLDYAVDKGIIEDSIVEKDLFDTRIMNCLMPRPSEVIREFRQRYTHSPQDATKYFYQLSIDSHYIRKNRTDQNIKFQKYYKYGNIDITINLSKPEKDPKDIAKAKLVKTSGYPQCLLCKENVGFSGDFNRPARQNHRIIPLKLNDTDYYLQYSPYVYYNEHCIVLNKEHIPMVINQDTFQHLLSFVEQFPHYMLGSNADLPIVGGSILTHDHYQGGCYEFPMNNADVIKTMSWDKYPDLKIEILKWPLSTIRVTCQDSQKIVEFATKTLKAWKNYSNPSLDILSHSDQTPHNTITPIARMKNHDYQMDLVLRNNRTSQEHPDGIFHPHASLHHIKKENIGLIEVMGLAVLPARLKVELELLKDCLLGKKEISEYPELQKHELWYNEIKENYQIQEDTVDDVLKTALTIKFVEVLEDAGVFKMNDEGIEAFCSFVESLCKEEDNND